jgi:hypothetical protein
VDTYQDEPYETPVHQDEQAEAEVHEPRAVFASDPVDEIDEDAPDESWWQEPQDEDDTVEDDRAPEVVGEGLSEMPTVAPVEDSEDAEEDTEAFLEKVFSELDSDKSETDEGHGLLRRRRMGTLRDFSSDS